MKPCPTCAREIADSDSLCATCAAWAAAVVEARPADAAAPAAEKPALKVQPAAAAPTAGASERRATSRRPLTLIAAAAVTAVALTGLALSARGGSRSDASASPTAAAPPAHVTTTPMTAPAASAVPDEQTWSTENQAAWLDNPRRGAAFELLSENVVRTGFGATRPLLVVRCISHSIEAFVVTGSPMKIDPRVDGKAVTISVDGEPFRTERWNDSDRHTEVFAPDPRAFTERLRTARTLQFGYSPHNSSDVVAQFHVAGIDALMGAASKHCSAPK